MFHHLRIWTQLPNSFSTFCSTLWFIQLFIGMLLQKHYSVLKGISPFSCARMVLQPVNISTRCSFRTHAKHLWDIAIILGCRRCYGYKNICFELCLAESPLLLEVLFQVIWRASLQPLSLFLACPHLQYWPCPPAPPALLLITKTMLENIPEHFWWRELLKNRQMLLLVCKLLLHSTALSQNCC